MDRFSAQAATIDTPGLSFAITGPLRSCHKPQTDTPH
jgi:hypothetical protein